MFSWLIQMFIGNLPEWVWPVAAGASVAVYFLAGVISHIPQISPYGRFVKPAAVISLLLSIFMYGGAGVAAIYKEQIKEAEVKATLAEAQAKEANAQIHTVYVDRIKTIHDTKVVVQTKIKEIEKKINADCHVAKEAIDALNQAASTGGTK